MCVNVLPACMYVHRMPACWIPGTGVLEGCEPSYGCWASNQVPCKNTSALDYWAISPVPWEDILMSVYTLAHFFPGGFTLKVAWHDKHSYFTSSLGVWVCRGFKTDILTALVQSPEASPWDMRLFPVLWEKCFLQAASSYSHCSELCFTRFLPSDVASFFHGVLWEILNATPGHTHM